MLTGSTRPDARNRVRSSDVHRVEFTIEPFNDGHLGPHVAEAIAGVEALGIAVEVGPFGSSCHVEPERSDEVVATVIRLAFAHGASHVNIDVDAAPVDTGDRP